MNTYSCRVTKPSSAQAHWSEVAAPSPGEAAEDFYFGTGFYEVGVNYWHEFEPGKYETIRFARIEVRGHGEFVVRVFYRGIYRVSASALRVTLADIARRLRWTKPAGELIAPGWEREESGWGVRSRLK